jgi:hypothetical protein
MAVGSLSAAEAVFLFAARADDAGITLSAADPVVGRIVARLDGLPLAIELAAARTRGLSVADIEQRLGERFRLLRGSSRGRVERHQTLWSTVAWSHQLLDKVERLVFDRLAVFAGGFTLEAAAAVCADDDDDPVDVEDAILGLVERSMALVEPSADGTRYRPLETLRSTVSSGPAASARSADLRSSSRTPPANKCHYLSTPVTLTAPGARSATPSLVRFVGGDHLTLWQSVHFLVTLLVEGGDRDTAAEIWAELRDRGDWTETAVRAHLEARLGFPGTPHLTDDELTARMSALITELE